MVPDGRFTAVLDRFEEGREGRLAVLVLERDGEDGTEAAGAVEDSTEATEAAEDGTEAVSTAEDVVGDLAVPPGALPADARHPDAVLDVVVDDGTLLEVRYREAATARRKENAQARFDRLAGRSGDGPDDEPRDDRGTDGED